MFFARLVQRQARDVEQWTEERNIQQRSICHRNEQSLVEFVDQHHFARSNNYVHDDFSERSEQEGKWIFFRIFDPGKNGLQLTVDFSMQLKNEFVLDDPNVIFPYIRFLDDDKERPVEMCSLKTYPLQNASGNDKVINIADTRHIQRRSERKIVAMLCKGDLDFLCTCSVTPEHLRRLTHERTPGIPRNLDDLKTNEFADVLGRIDEDLHLTRCAQVRFTGTEDDQAEHHDHGTIDEVLGDPDMERGGDAPEEADREADPPEQIPLLGHPEVDIDVFEIIDLVDMRSSTLDAVCMGVTYVQEWVERKSNCTSPSLHTRLQAFHLRLVTSGWLAQTLSIRPGNARQRRIHFNFHQQLCDDQSCWIGNAGTKQQSVTTR